MIKVNLDEAAFYSCLGLKHKMIRGDTPLNTKYEFKLPLWAKLYKKYIGLVPYSKYLGWRKNLKHNSRQLHGLPAHYQNKKSHFTLADLAIVK